MIILGITLLIALFLGLWKYLINQEKPIKKYFKKIETSGRLRFLKSRKAWLFWLPLLLGGIFFIISSWIFGEIAEDIVSRDPLTMTDVHVNKWFSSHTSPLVTKFMLFISDLASYPTTIVVYLLFVIILTFKKRWYELVFLSLSIPGGMFITHMMKVAFRRPRPFFHLFPTASLDYSFPSGHTMNATLLYGALILLLLPLIKTWSWQVFTVLFALFMVILVALSRVYLGYHYLSDTLAAVAVGTAWLSLCFVAVVVLQQAGRKGHGRP